MTDRRKFLKSAGAIAAAAGLGVPAIGVKSAHAATKHVVVIGSGFGGSTAAKYLRLWGQGQINVTLVDAVATYKTPILSNLVLNGRKTMTDLSFSLATVAARNGVSFIQGTATIDRSNAVVHVTRPDGSVVPLSYDKLVVAPGIDFNYPPGMAAANAGASDLTLPIPHAWKSGDQVLNLKAQINRLPKGTGKVVVCIPKKPYRCPPGPYERVCVIADILKRVKGGGKVVVFDANPPTNPLDKYSAIQAEVHTFTTAFTGLYAGIVEYVSGATLTAVSARGGQFGTKTATVTLADGSVRTEQCQVLNVIPQQKAGKIAFDAGLVLSGNFVEVDLYTYASKADSNIHVIGDAHHSAQPKAGHIANSEAKICADAIARGFDILPPRAADEVPVTNSACYSPITYDKASWLTAGYRYNPTTGQMDRIAESFAEADAPSSDNHKMMLAWAANLFADVF